MDALISAASSSFTAVFGFGLGDVSGWMWTNIMAPVIGAGLALIVILIPYIVALALVTVIVFFGYKAWTMWRGH
jgi:hypothetical protein